MRVELDSPCKVNLVLNILGKRPDGFHELETVMHPVALHDRLAFDRAENGIHLTCSNPELPVDSGNLVYRAGERFFERTGIRGGVRIHLEKRIPLAAGLGGGSGNAATALRGLNDLFEKPLAPAELDTLARALGSDVPFFLQDNPAIAAGRGEEVVSIPRFATLAEWHVVLIHPGFGVSTPWAYKNLARFPSALNGIPGRAARFVEKLRFSVATAAPDFYNSLEAPVLEKFPLLAMFQEFLRSEGAPVALMSGSGSTTFALVENARTGEQIIERFRAKFGTSSWTACVAL